MEEKKFLYSVNPRKVIKNIAGVAAVRTSKSLFLTKEEVLECVKCGTVYRRFSADKIVKVTPAELDRLHREEFMTEQEYAKFNADSQGKDRGTTKEVPTVDDKESKVDENTAQGSVTSPSVEKDSEINSEVVPEDVTEIAEESNSDDEDQVETASVNEEADADDRASDSSETTTVVNEEISVSDKVEVEDAMSDQVRVDQAADSKPNFHASSIQVNTSGKKKNKGKR